MKKSINKVRPINWQIYYRKSLSANRRLKVLQGGNERVPQTLNFYNICVCCINIEIYLLSSYQEEK